MSTESVPVTHSLPDLLAERFPPLARYCPNLATLSQQQGLFLLLDCQEAFYGGAAGGGKSDALLMGGLQYVDVPRYSALLLRRTYEELSRSDGLIPRAESWLAGTDARKLDGGRKWVFPSGARLEFGHVKDEADKFNYQSAAYQYIGFDEATSFSQSMYEYIAFSRSRRLALGRIAKVPIRVRAASNPGNVGHLWVKQRFVDATTRKPGVVFIPAKVQDNPGLDVEQYRQTMSHLSEALQAQLLEGSWSAFEDMAFAKFGDAHLVDDFPLGDAYERFEAMDYGFNGTAWALVATDFDGNVIFYDSIAESDRLPDEIAALVSAKRKHEGWGFSNTVWADPSIWHRTATRNRFGDPAVLADEFGESGVPLTRANPDPRAGYARIRTLIEPDEKRRFPLWHPRAGEYGSPRMFVVARRCPELVEQLRAAPLQPVDKRDGGEMVDPVFESRHGHFVAMCRYAVMAKPAPSTPPVEELSEEDSVRQEQQRLIRQYDEQSDNPRFDRSRYVYE
jgi:Terminase large subunit, T4likevirus-type, N-terminal